MIAIAEELDMQVVAEGVESQAVMNQLTEMGCDMVQGFYISEPKPADEITNWLNENPTISR